MCEKSPRMSLVAAPSGNKVEKSESWLHLLKVLEMLKCGVRVYKTVMRETQLCSSHMEAVFLPILYL